MCLWHRLRAWLSLARKDKLKNWQPDIYIANSPTDSSACFTLFIVLQVRWLLSVMGRSTSLNLLRRQQRLQRYRKAVPVRQSWHRPGLGPSPSMCSQTLSQPRHPGRMGRWAGVRVMVLFYYWSVFISFVIREAAWSSDKVRLLSVLCPSNFIDGITRKEKNVMKTDMAQPATDWVSC